jgi:hypothetical protein
MIGATALGSRCRKMIRPSRLPSARAASQNSFSRKLRNDARTSRATGGPREPPMMTTITPKLSAALFDVAETIAVSTSSSGNSGIDSTRR